MGRIKTTEIHDHTKINNHETKYAKPTVQHEFLNQFEVPSSMKLISNGIFGLYYTNTSTWFLIVLLQDFGFYFC